jgi:hypothetical protein
MKARNPLIIRLLSGLIACALFGATSLPAYAQFFDESLQEDDFFENDDSLFESGTDEFGFSRDEDFTEGDQYVDESFLAPGSSVTAGSRRVELRMVGEREALPMNGAWGAGTGLLIGGWFALINQGDNRATQRSIGMGIVLGAIIGVTVGLKTVINPNAPSALGQSDTAQPKDDSFLASNSFQPLLAFTNTDLKLGFNLKF